MDGLTWGEALEAEKLRVVDGAAIAAGLSSHCLGVLYAEE